MCIQQNDQNIDSLPLWAQNYIGTLQRVARSLQERINALANAQERGPVYVETFALNYQTGLHETTRQYIASDRVTFEHRGVKVEVLVRDSLSLRPDGIEIIASDGDNKPVGFVPINVGSLIVLADDKKKPSAK